jgi:hypothetical protein
MRGVGVNSVGVFRVTVFFLIIERTFTEAAEQTPRPRAGSAQAAGATNNHAQARGARRSPTGAGGFVFAEPMAHAPLLSVPVAMPRTPETYS